MNDSSRRSWLLALLLGLAIPVGAATPTVDIQDVFPTERHVISSGPIRFRTVARGTDADPVTSLSVMVTNLTDNSLVLSNSSPVTSAPIVALDQAFTPARIGQYQITAAANTLSMAVGSDTVTVIVTNVALGERPYTQGIYIAAHNAYWRSESLNAQIDDHNVWQIELDVFWDDNEMWVDHDCVAPPARRLSEVLAEISLAADLANRFTVFYLELKQPNSETPCHDDWPTDFASYRAAISNQFTAYFPASRFYTPTEFGGIDRRYWPSVQELMRRGKNYAIIVGEIVTTGKNNDGPFLFSEVIRGDGDYGINQVQVSESQSGATYPDTSTQPPIYLWRVYPGSNAEGDANEDDWQNFSARGYNFIALNKLDSDTVITDSTGQAPEPTYLDLNTSASRNWGTRAYPFRVFDAAYWRASPMTTIKLKPGTYTLFFTNVLSKSVVLKKDGTDASNPIIRKP